MDEIRAILSSMREDAENYKESSPDAPGNGFASCLEKYANQLEEAVNMEVTIARRKAKEAEDRLNRASWDLAHMRSKARRFGVRL